MSMLTEQCMRLRSWARQFDERADIDALAPLLASDLREAADTIINLRNKLQSAEHEITLLRDLYFERYDTACAKDEEIRRLEKEVDGLKRKIDKADWNMLESEQACLKCQKRTDEHLAEIIAEHDEYKAENQSEVRASQSNLYAIDEHNLRLLYHLGYMDCKQGRYNMPASGLARIECRELSEESRSVDNDEVTNLEWLIFDSEFSGECKMAMYDRFFRLPGKPWNSHAEFCEWLMAPHKDDWS